MIGIALRKDDVSIEALGPETPDGDGGYTRAPVTLASHILGQVRPATPRDLERVVANTVQATASHLVTIPYVEDVTTESQVIFHDPVKGDRRLSVTGVFDELEQHDELILTCIEIVSR